MSIVKAEYYRLNGNTWEKHYFKTSADLVEGLEQAIIDYSTPPNLEDYLKKSGGTMTGNLDMGWNTLKVHTIEEEKCRLFMEDGMISFEIFEVQDIDASVLAMFQTHLSTNNKPIKDIADAVEDKDAVNLQTMKEYVDNKAPSNIVRQVSFDSSTGTMVIEVV